jgi:type II secretory pathway pseudopilin PulG
MIKIMNQRYEGLGFVEALIAIMVVGISSVVLMQIAVGTMQSMVQNDLIDKMTQYAVEGAEMAQDIANRDVDPGTNLFPDPADIGVGKECFVLMEQETSDESKGSFYFLKDTESAFLNYAYGEPYEYKTTAVIPGDEDLFRIVCLQYEELVEPKYVVAKVIIGQVNSDGTITRGNQVKDYTYFTVIKL